MKYNSTRRSEAAAGALAARGGRAARPVFCNIVITFLKHPLPIINVRR